MFNHIAKHLGSDKRRGHHCNCQNAVDSTKELRLKFTVIRDAVYLREKREVEWVTEFVCIICAMIGQEAPGDPLNQVK